MPLLMQRPRSNSGSRFLSDKASPLYYMKGTKSKFFHEIMLYASPVFLVAFEKKNFYSLSDAATNLSIRRICPTHFHLLNLTSVLIVFNFVFARISQFDTTYGH